MKKTALVLSLVILVFLSGCESLNPPKYLQPVSPSEDITQQNQPYYLKFFVVNPTQNTFTGTIEYQFNSKCISTYPSSDIIDVTPQEYKKPITKQFNYLTENSRYGQDTNQCFQTPLRITAVLKDKGGEIKETLNVLLRLTN